MWDQWVKSSHMHFWAPPSLSRQWLVRVANHTQLLIRGVSRFSTNIYYAHEKRPLQRARQEVFRNLRTTLQILNEYCIQKESECLPLESQWHSLLLPLLPISPHIQVTRSGSDRHTQSSGLFRRGVPLENISCMEFVDRGNIVPMDQLV